MIRASVMGATGYAGAELIRLLTGHPEVKVVAAASQRYAGEELSKIYANFTTSERLSLMNPEELASQETDVVFLALPHGESMKQVPKLLEAGVKVIDLSADFRYADTGTYEAWYSREHVAAEANGKAVYGLPEYNAARIQDATLIANPGCYPTAAILAMVPLLREGLVRPEGIIVNGASGVTGAGRRESVEYSFSELDDNYKAYSPVRHQHTSEMEEQMATLGGVDLKPILFTPHLLPVKRGILLTIYADLAPGATQAKMEAAYEKAYADATFTAMMPGGAMPSLNMVVGSNNCMMGFALSERTGRVVVCSAMDNLLKGAAGQAVQNMNVLFGLPQDAGLPVVAWHV